MLGIGADEHEAVLDHHLREIGVLREEAVAGMDRMRARDLGRGENGDLVEIGFARRRRPDAHARIRQPDVHRIGIGGRMHRHALDPHLPAGADDPERDLAPIRHQNLVEHGHRRVRGYSMISRSSPYSTGSPLVTSSLAILPLRGARIGFITFIASMIKRVAPSRTSDPTVMNGGAPGSGVR